MRLLITGGAGFIGSHLCERYTKAGETVICLDNFLSGNPINIRHLLDYRNFKLVKGDIRDEDLMDRLMVGVDVVFHLAAQVHVDRSYIEPKLTYDINVMGTQTILQAARMHDVKRVIHASSSEVYGSASYAPIDERHPLNAPHPYGASKIAADRMSFAYARTYGMDIVVVRPFNVFGPRQRDLGYGGVISIFTRRVLSAIPPVIFGDGRQTRDYTYVDDVVNGYDAILRHADPVTEPVNFGTGTEVAIVELAEMIIDICGKKGRLQVVHTEPRIGEVNRLVADTRRAQALFGWKPAFDFENGLRAYIDWYRRFGFEERTRLE